jgi:hypothetical protein
MRTSFIMLVLLLLMLGQNAIAQDDSGDFEPFIQSDFKVLTGDVQRPNGIYWHDGFLYTGCAGDFTLYRLDANTGDTITYIFGIKNAHSLYVEADPLTVWAVDFQDNALVRIVERQGIEKVREGLAAPWGLAPSATDDTFFITEWESDNLINITRTGEISVVASNFEDPSGIIATEETLYVANNASARRAVEWLDITGEGSSAPQPLVSGLQNVTNLVMGPDGKLYMAYALGTRGVVGRIDPDVCKEQGGCTNIDVELVVWTDLAAPLAGLVITPEMRLYVHTIYGTEIYWLDLPVDVAQAE